MTTITLKNGKVLGPIQIEGVRHGWCARFGHFYSGGNQTERRALNDLRKKLEKANARIPFI